MVSRLEQHRSPEPFPPIHDAEHLVDTHRSKFGKVLEFRDFAAFDALKDKLISLNPERAEDFSDDIRRIHPNLPYSVKIKSLEKILERYSPHTLGHVLMGRGLVDHLKSRKEIGILQSLRLDDLAEAIESHDFGKLGMRDSTLNVAHDKDHSYNPQEIHEKEAHPILGRMLLSYLKFPDFSQRIALTHHLRYETVDGKPQLIGYPVKEFEDYCDLSNLPHTLKPEDHLAAFIDVFSALTDVNRVTNKHGTNDSGLSEEKRKRLAFEVMDQDYFKDDFYQRGAGAPLLQAFKKAMLEESHDHPKRKIALEESHDHPQRLAS